MPPGAVSGGGVMAGGGAFGGPAGATAGGVAGVAGDRYGPQTEPCLASPPGEAEERLLATTGSNPIRADIIDIGSNLIDCEVTEIGIGSDRI